jgi:aspartyl-tRNA(Asn)/glutamyl-tRNA(Gln) amidotransferase subunit B
MEIKYKPIVGLEIHIEQNTKSKMFCQCPADYFGAEPNTHTCPVCLGMPGGLPVPNEEAIRRTMMLGLALNCHINREFKFDRKHYFYPDLAKGYQISQYDEPIAVNGNLKIRTINGIKEFRIKRVHLEEDTGKLSHDGDISKIDFNRGGVPLMEIVTEPDFSDGEDVKIFLEELQILVRYLGIANADMEKGDMRLEPNISVQLLDKYPELPDYKVEVKNINSFRFVKKSIEYEVDRHIEILENGEIPPQETRGWDNTTGTTVSQRTKEDAHDYRYFPEPDIPVFEYSDEFIENLEGELPELPFDKVTRYIDELGIKDVDAHILTRSKSDSEYFESILKVLDKSDKEKNQKIANSIINKKISSDLSPEDFVKQFEEESKPIETDSGLLDKVVADVISSNDKAIEDYKSGSNPNAIMFLVGQVMKEMKGQADAQTVKSKLEEIL